MQNLLKFGIGIIFLILLSIIDYTTYNKKNGNIPASISTTFILISFFLSSDFFILVVSIILSLLFTDLDLWGGIADIKVFIASSLLIGTNILLFAFFVCFISIIYKWVSKKYKLKTMPFIPVISLAFIIVYFIP